MLIRRHIVDNALHMQVGVPKTMSIGLLAYAYQDAKDYDFVAEAADRSDRSAKYQGWFGIFHTAAPCAGHVTHIKDALEGEVFDVSGGPGFPVYHELEYTYLLVDDSHDLSLVYAFAPNSSFPQTLGLIPQQRHIYMGTISSDGRSAMESFLRMANFIEDQDRHLMPGSELSICGRTGMVGEMAIASSYRAYALASLRHRYNIGPGMTGEDFVFRFT